MKKFLLAILVCTLGFSYAVGCAVSRSDVNVVTIDRVMRNYKYAGIKFRDNFHIEFVPELFSTFPDENMLCVYGRKLNQEKRIFIDSFEKAIIGKADTIGIFRKDAGDFCNVNDEYLGTAHTHTVVTQSSQDCVFSPTDWRMSKEDQQSVVHLVYCANGEAYFEFFDGAYGEFIWAN